MQDYGWIWILLLPVHLIFGFLVWAMMGDKGYKDGAFGYFLFGLLFGILALFCSMGMPISREEQAERDKGLVTQIMNAQGITDNRWNDEKAVDEDPKAGA